MSNKMQQHALVVPFPLQGHIAPLLQISQHLAASHGFLITFVNTEVNYASFLRSAHSKQLARAAARERIHMVALSDGLPFDAQRNPSNLSNLMAVMPRHMTPLLECIISDSRKTSSPITCVIADLFLPWIHDLARRSNVPAVVGFHASSIAQFSSLFHIPLLVSRGQLNCDGSANVETITGIPGVLDIPVSTYPWITGDPTRRQQTFKGLASVKGDAEQLDAVIFNSFTELEKETVDALIKQAGLKTKMLPIGPMILLNDSTDGVDHIACRIDLSPQEKVCLDWLDTKSKGSVLYIAFGTTAWLDKKELNALALGIEASGASFLWVLRSDLLVGESAMCGLPEGFVERTTERAHFTAWAPQPLVLSHPAIGGFITHGGWNSALEAICNGVPMLTWPDFWDQKMHSEQVVREWKVGMQLRSDHGQVVEQGEVEDMVRRIMPGTGGGGGGKDDDWGEQVMMREKVEAWKSKARLAHAKDSGSSYNDLRQLVQLVQQRSSGSISPV